MRTILKSNDGWLTVAAKNGKFFLCEFNPATNKYRRLHRYGTFYHIVLRWFKQYVEPTPVQTSLFTLFDDPVSAGLWN